jgi:hypothetical protein
MLRRTYWSNARWKGLAVVKIVAHFLLVTILVTTLIAGGWQKVAGAPSKTLVFEGTVTSITTINHRLTPWLATVKITKVISGEFSGSTFQFAVHSPARSGLEKGRSYTIEAVWKDHGYVVDENQFLRPGRKP